MAPFIAALDLGTITGVAHGLPGSKPQFWSWHLSDAGKARPKRFARLLEHLEAYFRQHKVDYAYYEAPVPLSALVDRKGDQFQVAASNEGIIFSRGLIGIFEAAASTARVPLIEAVNVQDARKHFCGRARFPKGEAKAHVMRTCQMLGHDVEDDHQADAVAIWTWAEARANPRLAHLTSPLFREAR